MTSDDGMHQISSAVDATQWSRSVKVERHDSSIASLDRFPLAFPVSVP